MFGLYDCSERLENLNLNIARGTLVLSCLVVISIFLSACQIGLDKGRPSSSDVPSPRPQSSVPDPGEVYPGLNLPGSRPGCE